MTSIGRREYVQLGLKESRGRTFMRLLACGALFPVSVCSLFMLLIVAALFAISYVVFILFVHSLDRLLASAEPFLPARITRWWAQPIAPPTRKELAETMPELMFG